MASKDLAEKVAKLSKLALSKDKAGEPTEEARTAAVQALTIAAENDLVLVPRADVEAARTAVEGLEKLRAEAKKRIKKAKKDGQMQGALLTLVATKGGFF